MPNKPGKFLPALYGGIIMGIISGIPFLSFLNCFCCAGIMFGGFMSVFFYKNNLKPEMPPLQSGDAVALGALAGVVGAFVSAIIGGIVMALLGNVAAQFLYNTLENTGALSQVPPEAMQNLENSLQAGGFSPLHLFISLLLDPTFGLLGGLIGYSIFKPKVVLTAAPPPPPPMPQP
jgi:hypothetical protein